MTKVKGYDLDTSAHAEFSLFYHIIFVTKYRRQAMHSEAIRERLKEIMRDLAPRSENSDRESRAGRRSYSPANQGDA